MGNRLRDDVMTWMEAAVLHTIIEECAKFPGSGFRGLGFRGLGFRDLGCIRVMGIYLESQ